MHSSPKSLWFRVLCFVVVLQLVFRNQRFLGYSALAERGMCGTGEERSWEVAYSFLISNPRKHGGRKEGREGGGPAPKNGPYNQRLPQFAAPASLHTLPRSQTPSWACIPTPARAQGLGLVSLSPSRVMSSCSRVAIVTGSKKGIGFAIVRDLCKKFPGDVILTARNPTLGQEAVNKLKQEGLNPLFHQLDITDLQSIGTLREFLKERYGGVDVLVNNAGIAFKAGDTTPFPIQAEVTLQTNFFGTRVVSGELLPLIKPQGRVVNVSSFWSLQSLKNCSPELQQKFRSDTITEEELVGLMNKFVEDAKKGVHKEEVWPTMAYGVSKIGVTVLSRIQARQLNEQRKGDNILLNACCPGWVRTDMGGPWAPKSVEEGVETPVYLTLLSPSVTEPHRQFVSEKKVDIWET
ncbi:carbonyl reductase [NADPH] 1-like [Notamacropus eugenii]|uniref:carbonyl reductase [NADPH] 1-like n=1 Tax=Notamacropus eugenii TaxID=9315 RepID=UPI003B67C180